MSSSISDSHLQILMSWLESVHMCLGLWNKNSSNIPNQQLSQENLLRPLIQWWCVDQQPMGEFCIWMRTDWLVSLHVIDHSWIFSFIKITSLDGVLGCFYTWKSTLMSTLRTQKLLRSSETFGFTLHFLKANHRTFPDTCRRDSGGRASCSRLFLWWMCLCKGSSYSWTGDIYNNQTPCYY